MSLAAYNTYERLEIDGGFDATMDGYLYIYVANETNLNQEVYFDDIKVTHESALANYKVSQVNEYYLYGLPTANSWRNEGYIDPGLLYQSSFASYDTLTGYYDFLSRSYDPATGRFFAVDPAGQFSSPYVGMGNMPHWGIDPDGEFFDALKGLAVSFLVNTTRNVLSSSVNVLNGGSFNDSFFSNGFSGGASFSFNNGPSVFDQLGPGGCVNTAGQRVPYNRPEISYASDQFATTYLDPVPVGGSNMSFLEASRYDRNLNSMERLFVQDPGRYNGGNRLRWSGYTRRNYLWPEGNGFGVDLYLGPGGGFSFDRIADSQGGRDQYFTLKWGVGIDLDAGPQVSSFNGTPSPQEIVGLGAVYEGGVGSISIERFNSIDYRNGGFRYGEINYTSFGAGLSPLPASFHGGFAYTINISDLGRYLRFGNGSKCRSCNK